jgi:hypothetical protein
VIPEEELHDQFEPQGGLWRELLEQCIVDAVLSRAISDTVQRYRRSLIGE